MTHFIIGPVQMYPEAMNIRQNDFSYFRSDDFSKIMMNNAKRLSLLMNCPSYKNIIFLTMSGTGAMEAAIENCLSHKDRVLVVNGGTFGKRFCELLNRHCIAYDAINLKWNEQLTLQHLCPFEKNNYDALLVNLHETSTGQLYDIKLLSDFAKRKNSLLMVDAISTFMADEYDMEKNGIDVTIISSQKGLCCSPGLSIVALSDRAKEKIISQNSVVSTSYFNFYDYLQNMERGQTPYTPAVGIVYELDAMLNLIIQTGKKEWLQSVAEKATYFRNMAIKKGFTIPCSYPHSNALTPVLFTNLNAKSIVNYLREHFQLYVNPCGGELSNSLIRVAHIGDTNLKDFDNLIEKMTIAIKNIKGL